MQLLSKNELSNQLIEILDANEVKTDQLSCVLYSQDVYTKDKSSAMVIQPSSTEKLAEAVLTITQAGYSVVARGGGMSYTRGYVPDEEHSVIIDMSALNSVIEVNTKDMYVTVECGCSWEKLYQTLKDYNLRTPFWGTLSGRFATVGGSLSQNGIFWGSAQHGFAVDSVLSLEVILSDGKTINTGSAAKQETKPFTRHFGPDLTGLFCNDSAALGIKTKATIRLIPEALHKGSTSISFTEFNHQAELMSEVARQGLASECFGFDPFLQAQRLQRESLGKDIKSLFGVMKAAGSVGKALKAGSKIALAGRDFIESECWSVHFMVEDWTEQGVELKLNRINQLAKDLQGTVVENTIPKVLSANPFGPVNNMVGPKGERWVPVHALVPHSSAQEAYNATEAVFKKHADAIAKHNIGIGYLLATVSSTVFVLEPVFFWPDELNELHKSAVEPAHLKRLPGFSANPAASEALSAIRADLMATYADSGYVHMQLGKTYKFKEVVDKENYQLLSDIKNMLDANNRLNPGCLGFN
ncbi:FAD/FMN-containing dehydrogenase [Colwellia chukchiensis]|uniref:FAD/FMN-containing dehydrogenase n=1 Tax=Colwellia chukchiensis TaxID=641665 RepID=A0A1H7NKT7_9GAMM|nr:FAD-binding oxidoreductase [Colwellia chukchiensis]SEL24096.1 FAD/FMN-containing dehydrogenase [Colwellia chukchiensis]